MNHSHDPASPDDFREATRSVTGEPSWNVPMARLALLAGGLMLGLLFLGSLLKGCSSSSEQPGQVEAADGKKPPAIPEITAGNSLVWVPSEIRPGEPTIRAPITYYRDLPNRWNDVRDTLNSIPYKARRSPPPGKGLGLTMETGLPLNDKLVSIRYPIYDVLSASDPDLDRLAGNNARAAELRLALGAVWEDYPHACRDLNTVIYRVFLRNGQIVVMRDIGGDLNKDPNDPEDYATLFTQPFEGY